MSPSPLALPELDSPLFDVQFADHFLCYSVCSLYEVLPWFRCFVVAKMHKLFQVDVGVLACYVVCAVVVVVIGVVVVVAAFPLLFCCC